MAFVAFVSAERQIQWVSSFRSLLPDGPFQAVLSRFRPESLSRREFACFFARPSCPSFAPITHNRSGRPGGKLRRTIPFRKGWPMQKSDRSRNRCLPFRAAGGGA
ncbi:hypothetical protein BOX30_03405 [Leptospirillum ferriphilum]|nr:hypothetical protein BOX30_03405 [Leptospirillum ferriphilum]